jgi:SAM-dependent methyltransferase
MTVSPVVPRPLTARHRLEAWLEARAEHLAGPLLDVGTSKGSRRWIPVPRVTLDASETLGADLVADLEDLTGLPDGVFGSVICTEVLEHVRHPIRALQELRRVTAPGGALLASVPWLYPFHPCPLDLRRFTLQGLVHDLEEAGWTVREAEGLPIPEEAHEHLVAAIRLVTGGRCPQPESLRWSNWVVRATA